MKRNEGQVLRWTGVSEGGYVNDKEDPGGPTNKGVTQRVYDGWRRMNGMETRDVRFITREEADRIFIDQYFAPVWFDRLPSGLDYAMGDYAINSGPMRAVKDLQRCLVEMGHALAVDGHMGVITMSAVQQEDPAELVYALCHRRLAFMQSLAIWPRFKNGWTRRVMGEFHGAQEDDTGVIDRGMRMARDMQIIGAPKPASGKASAPEDHRARFDLMAIIRSLFKDAA